MINKIKNITKTFALILFSTFILSTNIFASTGILPYTKDPNTGEILVLLGFEAKKNWTDFSGGMKPEDKGPAHAAAREGAEETLERFGTTAELWELTKNTPYFIEAQVSGKNKSYTYLHSCYLIQVNWIDTQEFKYALTYPEYQYSCFQEKSDFTWVKLTDLCKAIEWANTHNTNNNVLIFSGKNKPPIKLFNKFVEMLKQGLDILQSCISQQIPGSANTSSSSSSSTSTSYIPAQKTDFDFDEFSQLSEESDYIEPTYFGSYEKDLKLFEKKTSSENKKKKKNAEFKKPKED